MCGAVEHPDLALAFGGDDSPALPLGASSNSGTAWRRKKLAGGLTEVALSRSLAFIDPFWTLLGGRSQGVNAGRATA